MYTHTYVLVLLLATTVATVDLDLVLKPCQSVALLVLLIPVQNFALKSLLRCLILAFLSLRILKSLLRMKACVSRVILPHNSEILVISFKQKFDLQNKPGTRVKPKN